MTVAGRRLSVITPTCNRPVALDLTRRWMAAQTLQPDEWIIIDGADARATHPPGALNFLDNLERGVAAATGDRLIFWEDDDFYDPRHLEQMIAQWDLHPDACLIGDPTQRYYNISYRRYRVMANRGASLCQTGMSAALRPWFATVLATCRALVTAPAYGLDTRLWAPALAGGYPHVLAPFDTVVGIKGIPGQQGLGMGHQPARVAANSWTADPQLRTLTAWVGPEHAQMYVHLAGSIIATAPAARIIRPPRSTPATLRRTSHGPA